MLLRSERGGKQDAFWIEQLPAEEQASGALDASSTPPKAKPSVRAQQPAPVDRAAAAAALSTGSVVGEVIGSKTGTVYYLPTCSGAARILPVNRITYASRASAEANGLKPAKNCKGL